MADERRHTVNIAVLHTKVEDQEREIERLRNHVAKLYGRDKDIEVLKTRQAWLWTLMTAALLTGITALIKDMLS